MLCGLPDILRGGAQCWLHVDTGLWTPQWCLVNLWCQNCKIQSIFTCVWCNFPCTKDISETLLELLVLVSLFPAILGYCSDNITGWSYWQPLVHPVMTKFSLKLPFHFTIWPEAPLLKWINFKSSHPLSSVTWNYFSILKLQWCSHWIWWMDKWFHPTYYFACNYLSILWLKLMHIS